MHSNRVIALVVATLVSSASFAGAQGSAATVRAARAQGKAVAQRGDRDRLLRGVTLSDAEKANVTEIQARYRTEAQALHESIQPAMAEARAARQQGDTAAVRAVLERTRDDREKARELLTRQLADVRGALTSENQRVLDANLRQAKDQVSRRTKQRRSMDGRAGRMTGRVVGRARPNS